MGYTIQALIAKSETFSGALPEKLQVVRLQGGIDMIPLGTEVRKFYGISLCPLTDEGKKEIPTRLLGLCKRLSESATIAYIEAEFFGGEGMQAHALFSQSNAMGPAVISAHAINEALCSLGVARGASRDEFEAVGLGRFRDTDEWLACN